MAVPVPCSRRPRADRGFYLSQDARSARRQMFLEEGIGESRQPSAVHLRSGWSAQLSSSDPRTARRGLDASVMSASYAALCEQPDRIRPPRRQAPAESDAGTTKRTHRSAVASRDRGGTHDSQRPGSGNNPEQSVGASLGIWGIAGHPLIPICSAERRACLFDRSCNTSR